MLVVSTTSGVSVRSAAPMTITSAAASPIPHHMMPESALTPAPPTIMSAMRTALSTKASEPASGYCAITVTENQYTQAAPTTTYVTELNRVRRRSTCAQQNPHRHERDERRPQDAMQVLRLHRSDDEERRRRVATNPTTWAERANARTMICGLRWPGNPIDTVVCPSIGRRAARGLYPETVGSRR